MKTLGTVDLYDFYFNGKYLSSVGGTVAGKNGFKEYSLLPSRKTKTQRTINSDCEYVLNSKLNPREFTVPVLFQDDSGIEMRDIAGWLDTPDCRDFYFKDDTVKLKAKLADKDITLNTYSSFAGITDLNFIAYDPFFYEINPTEITLSGSTVITNLGNKICYPKIEVTTFTLTTVELHFYQDSVEYAFFTLSDLSGYAVMDCGNYTIKNSIGESLESHLTKSVGDSVYPYMKEGISTVVLIGNNIDNVSITPNYRWI